MSWQQTKGLIGYENNPSLHRSSLGLELIFEFLDPEGSFVEKGISLQQIGWTDVSKLSQSSANRMRQRGTTKKCPSKYFSNSKFHEPIKRRANVIEFEVFPTKFNLWTISLHVGSIEAYRSRAIRSDSSSRANIDFHFRREFHSVHCWERMRSLLPQTPFQAVHNYFHCLFRLRNQFHVGALKENLY